MSNKEKKNTNKKRYNEIYNSLTPEGKRNFVIIATFSVIVFTFLLMFFLRLVDDEPINIVPEPIVIKEEYNHPDSLKADRYKQDEEKAALLAKNAEKDEEIANLKRQNEAIKNVKANNDKLLQDDINKYPKYPPSPTLVDNYPEMPPRPSAVQTPPLVKVYGISTISNVESPLTPATASISVSKINYLPTNTIIKAVTLNAVYAPTRAAGKANPYPVQMYVTDLAFLPNGVRENIKSCMLLGESHGELQESRAHIRMLNISCLSKDGSGVIDNKIEGWVNGEDGGIGVPGVIEDNFGQLLTYSFIASAFSGAGDAISQGTKSIITTPLGGQVSNKLDWEDVLTSSAGSGASAAFDMLSKFFLDILKDISPVVRINARREVNVSLSRGVELKIDKRVWVDINTVQENYDEILNSLKKQ